MGVLRDGREERERRTFPSDCLVKVKVRFFECCAKLIVILSYFLFIRKFLYFFGMDFKI